MSETAVDTVTSKFDLTPSPRVLAMLGEINIEQWRCIAELVDNSVDGFLNADRAGTVLVTRRVDVTLPNTDKEGAQVRIVDNGVGMTTDVLQQAVRAGWTGNNPIDNLGLFGMGFNIATARLGSVTEVWTTREDDLEWHGLVIDFDELRRQKHFQTPQLTKPKADSKQHGTEVIIKRLKPEQRRWLAKGGNHTSIKRQLAKSYSSMLRLNGEPISFDLFVNNIRLTAWKHCVWGEDRVVPSPDLGNLPAVITFDHKQAERPYCTYCMAWLPSDADENTCPVCESVGTITRRTRRVRGWLGIQRYLHQSEFGIDFIRNGRKIEIANKDLFNWKDGEAEEREYPIDDQRNRGRIVGEVHIDHCRVNYTKDRFDRTDPFWDDMVQLLRGEGPLRPEKAKGLGFSPNESTLFRLFKAFRRTSPQSKQAGAYKKLLIVKDNDRASEMAAYFHEGHPDYQDDTKWWELVEEADKELLYPTPQPKPTPPGPGGGAGLPAGLLGPSTTPGGQPPAPPPTSTPAPPPRVAVPSLSRRYVNGDYGWNVEAFEAQPTDPDLLPTQAPWAMIMGNIPTKTYHFLYDPRHPIFRSITMTPRDALLTQLTWLMAEQVRSIKNVADVPAIITEFRSKYGDENLLDARTMATDAAQVLTDLAKAILSNCPEDERKALFDELPVGENQQVMIALAAKKIKPSDVTQDGSFLQYAPHEITRAMVERHPELCYDGKVWDEPYEALDYGDPAINEGTRASIRGKYASLINDAIYLARQDPSDLAASPREELVRAVMSLHLLRPDVET